MSAGDGSESSLPHHEKKKKTGRWLKRNSLQRSYHQREVDTSAPSLWLHHETMASFTLRREAQNHLQMWEHSAKKSKRMDGLWKSVVSRAKSEGKIVGWREEEQMIREATASEVLPWGAWPIRLDNQDGQSFYSLDDAQVNKINSSRHYFLNRDEEDVHDCLLRHSQLFEREIAAESTANVVRLLPAEGGRWTEANSRISFLSPVNASPSCRTSNGHEVEDTSDVEVVDINSGGPSCSASSSPTVTRDGPGRSPLVLPGQPALQKRQACRMTRARLRESRSATVSADNSFSLFPAAGDDGGDDDGDDDGDGSGTQSERRGGRKRRLGDPEETSRFDVPHRIRLESSGHDDPVNVLCGDQPRLNDDIWQGWTVAEPAKEAVRRVWARARRRVEDACDPRFVSGTPRSSTSSRNAASHTASSKRAPSAHGEGDSRGTVASSTASGGSIRAPNPSISSCLSRECEGLIDAVLQVILVERTRERAHASTRSCDVSDLDHDIRDRPSRNSWEDILRVMGEFSAKARTSDAGACSEKTHRGTGKPSDRSVSSVSGFMHASREEKGALEGRDLNGGTSAASEDPGRVSTRSGGDPKAWGGGGRSDGAVVVVSDRLPALPLNDAVLVRSYNRLLLYLHEKKPLVA